MTSDKMREARKVIDAAVRAAIPKDKRAIVSHDAITQSVLRVVLRLLSSVKEDLDVPSVASAPRESSMADEAVRYVAPPEWHTIETAPMDGTHILLFGRQRPHDMLRPTGPVVFSGYWNFFDEAWCSTASTWTGPFYDASYWMPLPVPPRDEPQASGALRASEASDVTHKSPHEQG
jgi:hypothetical protein